jgi:predicted RNA binding protein YcfA (HicA-like mRNA interferase family)
MSEKLYRDIVSCLRENGFELIRNTRHAVWRKPDDSRGVVVSRKMKDKNLARSLLRSAGIKDVRL